MTSLTENPAITAPRRHLTKSEQDALLKIDFYKHQRMIGAGRVQIGPAVFQPSTIASLKRHKLVTGSVPSLSPTMGGKLAIDRMKGATP